jgi:hypothetical protein
MAQNDIHFARAYANSTQMKMQAGRRDVFRKA